MDVAIVSRTRRFCGTRRETAKVQVHLAHSSKDFISNTPTVTFLKLKFHLNGSCASRDLKCLGNFLVLRVQSQNVVVCVNFLHTSIDPAFCFSSVFKGLVAKLGIGFLADSFNRRRTFFRVSQVARKKVKGLEGVGRWQELLAFTGNRFGVIRRKTAVIEVEPDICLAINTVGCVDTKLTRPDI
jgi:hypothetical protein